MKWFLYRNFPSLILGALEDDRTSSGKEIKNWIRRSVSEHPPMINREQISFFDDELASRKQLVLANELTDLLTKRNRTPPQYFHRIPGTQAPYNPRLHI